MIRYKLNPIIILINNGGYTIEAEIHDGPYNIINNWDYVGFVKALENGQGGLFAAKATTEEELVEALERCKGDADDSLCFIEVLTHRDDASRELLEWGTLVSASNSRPPEPK
jgi:pyruvate decarboxylase